MNKSAIRAFAAAARRMLTETLTERAAALGLPEEDISAHAYAWFVRIIETHFLEVNAPGISADTFGRISGETLLLRPDALLSPDSALMHLLRDIPGEDWRQVQLIGWMHQFYHADAKDRVFAALNRGCKVSAETLPAATQLFTPDWIVQYLTDNALGRLCSRIQPGLTYYMDAESALCPEPCPESIRVIDPCMGCGNILVYAFDVLMQIYRAHGWSDRDAARTILQRNLFGLDIDPKAHELAMFALLMKAYAYDPEILASGVRPALFVCLPLSEEQTASLPRTLAGFARQFRYADTLGSLLEITVPDGISGEIAALARTGSPLAPALGQLLRIGQLLSQTYDAVITNPPYLGSARMNSVLSDYVKAHFPLGRSDLFACFMERCSQLTRTGGAYAMITQHTWMFLTSFTKLRGQLLKDDIVSLLHLGQNAFSAREVGTIVQTAAFVIRKAEIPGFEGTYLDLCDARTPEDKRLAFLARTNLYTADKREFSKLPGRLIAYWLPDEAVMAFSHPRLGELAEPRQGMTTSQNSRFIRRWFEVRRDAICFDAHSREEAQASRKKWFPYNKGGGYRKWYGNHEYVINFENDGQELREFHAALNKEHSGGRIKNQEYYFRPSVTWTFIANLPGFRACPAGFLFDVAGSSLFTDPGHADSMLAFLCSSTARYFLRVINPTMNIQAADIKALPYIEPHDPRIAPLVRENIAICREDWDTLETSWDFRGHPLVRPVGRIAEAFSAWERECQTRFETLKANEQTLDDIFRSLYGLSHVQLPPAADKDVTVRRADLRRDVKGLVSYAVGCAFGRFGAHREDAPAVISLSGTHPLWEQIAAFVQETYGAAALEENLQFLADALGTCGEPRQVIRRYLASGFYPDHCRMYHKRPIYWMFSSGRRHAFRALVSMHRWDADTVSHVLHTHLHPELLQARAELANIAAHLQTAAPAERKRLRKAHASLTADITEMAAYAQKLSHIAAARPVIDLDDGVAFNHQRFADILERIRT